MAFEYSSEKLGSRKSKGKMFDFSNEYGDYVLVKKRMKFKKAGKFARKNGGYLAELESVSESSALFDEITGHLGKKGIKKTTSKICAGGSSYVWLGGSDAKKEASWTWVKSGDRIASDHPLWGSGSLGSEPDNACGGQDFLAMALETWPRGSRLGEGFGDGGDWNDVSGKNKLFFVIELL